MKVTVIKRFKDKETKKVYEKGDAYESTPERTADLLNKGFLKEILESKSGLSPLTSVLNSSVEEVKTATEGYKVDAFHELLEAEKTGKNRKSLIEHFETMITSVKDQGEGE